MEQFVPGLLLQARTYSSAGEMTLEITRGSVNINAQSLDNLSLQDPLSVKVEGACW